MYGGIPGYAELPERYSRHEKEKKFVPHVILASIAVETSGVKIRMGRLLWGEAVGAYFPICWRTHLNHLLHSLNARITNVLLVYQERE